MTVQFEVLNGVSYAALTCITEIKFAIETDCAMNKNTNTDGWVNILNSTGSRSLKVHVYGILTGQSTDNLIINSIISSISLRYRLNVNSTKQLEFTGVVSNYERIYEPDKFESFHFIIHSDDKIFFNNNITSNN